MNMMKGTLDGLKNIPVAVGTRYRNCMLAVDER